jgi:hypothetical protein
MKLTSICARHSSIVTSERPAERDACVVDQAREALWRDLRDGVSRSRDRPRVRDVERHRVDCA